MDTYLLIADGVAAAGGEVEGRIRPFRWWIRGKTAAGAENPAPLGQANDARNACLRTSVRRAINTVIAQLSAAEIAAGDSPMTTAASDPQIVPRQPASLPELRAADQGVADSLEAVLSDNTRRVYGAQWRLFVNWCGDVGLRSLPAEPLTVARYLAARAGSGASIATMRLATSAITKPHEWAKLESPCRDPGVRASLKGWGRRLSKPQR